ncbi:MAG: hypothetical protein IPM57_11060 [Oligoflexia bacterium]|nr:hypothetical protein [Oligoflexia bacterium]
MIFISYEQNFFDFLLSPEARVSKKWSRDLENLGKLGFLHKNFKDISELRLSFSSNEVESFFKTVPVPGLIQKTIKKNMELAQKVVEKNKKLIVSDEKNDISKRDLFILEIFVDGLEQDSSQTKSKKKDQKFLVQLNLVSKNSGNTVWELSRTY